MDWLTDPNVMEISDQIEKVNLKMLEKLKMRNEHIAVFFCTFKRVDVCDFGVCYMKCCFRHRGGLQAVRTGSGRAGEY